MDAQHGSTAEKAKQEFPPEVFKEWGKVMTGQWRSESSGTPEGGPEIHSSAQWILNNMALQGEFHVADQSGMWITVWNVDSKQIEQRTVNSDGSTVFTVISKKGNCWEWKQHAVYPNGEKETSNDAVTVSEDGNTLHHHVTHRVRHGQRLPEIKSVLKRVGT